MARPGFWDQREQAQELIRELKEIKELTEPWQEFEAELGELGELVELVREDESLESGLEEEFKKLEDGLSRLEFSVMLGGEEDPKNAIYSVQAGAGGTESCDWAEMLWRMYSRWCENHDFKVRVLSLTPGEEAGIKSLTALVEGRFAFGYLKAERGVHRLVRLSPFDSNHRRHTSFASVEVTPEVGEDINVEIDEKDIKMDTYRSSGAGGQHVNVTDSAVRLTHLPTGIVVQCQNERSQHKNRTMALKVLKSRLYQLELDRRKEELAAQHDDQKEIAWGSQIRSYVFHPYSMVKDLRTGLTVGDIKSVMDGEIDQFILEYLRKYGNR